MDEEVAILEEEVVKECGTCAIKHRINALGMTEEASKLAQAKCLMCQYSKNASMIETIHRTLGVERTLEDNWVQFEG